MAREILQMMTKEDYPDGLSLIPSDLKVEEDGRNMGQRITN